MKPGIDGGRIAILKKRLLQDTDLLQFWKYYFDNFAEHPRFKEMGSPCRNEFVTETLRVVGQKLFGRDSVVLNDFVLIEIPEFRLVHGCGSLQGRFTCVLYFYESKAGIVAVVTGPAGQMTFARITEATLESLKSATKRIQ